MYKKKFTFPEWYTEKTFKFYEKKIKQLKKEIYVHSQSAAYYSKLHFKIWVPSIIITGLSGVASFLSSSSLVTDDYKTGISLSVGILTSISTMFQSFSSTVDYSTKANVHRETADHYEKLLTKLEFEMELPNEENFVNDLEKAILDIQNKCKYFPPKHIVDSYVQNDKNTANDDTMINIKKLDDSSVSPVTV
jgi:uncharacterized protein (UPF0332 family)